MENGKRKGWPHSKLGNLYINRYAWPEQMISVPPSKDTEIIVVIPCYNEPGILDALESLENCTQPDCGVEIIIVINHADTENPEIKNTNDNTATKLEHWIKQTHQFKYFIIRAFDLPAKKAGVGLARKIGMDEAVRRFEELHQHRGIIVCYDADCTCNDNYLREIHKTYRQSPNTNAALIYFEHDINSTKEPEIKEAIINYEVHLRYYVQALKFAKFPFAFHTVGSCITVRSDVYQKQGGMNTRKAGEDFYFLQRIFPMENVKNISTATVFPSPRSSDRVPFGTGRAVGDMIKCNSKAQYTYHPQIFIDFKIFNDKFSKLWETNSIKNINNDLPESVRAYLEEIDFGSQIEKLKKNFKTQKKFDHAVQNWFNGFKALKFVHFARDHHYPNMEIQKAANWILKQRKGIEAKDLLEALLALRTLDKSE